MLEILGIILIILLSPVILIAGFLSLIIVLGIIYFVVILIVEGITKIVNMFKEKLKE